MGELNQKEEGVAVEHVRTTTIKKRKSRRTLSTVEMNELKETVANAHKKEDSTNQLFQILTNLDDLVRTTSNDLELSKDETLKQLETSIGVTKTYAEDTN